MDRTKIVLDNPIKIGYHAPMNNTYQDLLDAAEFVIEGRKDELRVLVEAGQKVSPMSFETQRSTLLTLAKDLNADSIRLLELQINDLIEDAVEDLNRG